MMCRQTITTLKTSVINILIGLFFITNVIGQFYQGRYKRMYVSHDDEKSLLDYQPPICSYGLIKENLERE
jgi:hypothetical protein